MNSGQLVTSLGRDIINPQIHLYYTGYWIIVEHSKTNNHSDLYLNSTVDIIYYVHINMKNLQNNYLLL